MEILFITHKYPPTIGGMEKQSFELINYTSKQHKVHTIAFDANNEGKTKFVLGLKSRVQTILSQNPTIDIIHLNDGTMGLFCLWLKKITAIPVAITFHGLEVVFPNKTYQKSILPKLHNLDAFICVSEATAKETVQRGFLKNKTFVVPNGVDPELADLKTDISTVENKIANYFDWKDLEGKKIITTLGRMTKRKGFTWFLEKIVPLLDDDTIFILPGADPDKKRPIWKKILPKKLTNEIELIFGAVDESHTLHALLKDNNISHKVCLLGKVPFKEAMSLLSLAHLFVMPNVKVKGDAEGFGLVALEASIRGTTVLASGIEGITDAIKHYQNGILLPSKDVNAWINCINEQLSDFDALERQSVDFQQYTINNYSWQKMSQGYLTVFEHVLDRNKNLQTTIV